MSNGGSNPGSIAILVGGGPAPGINGVIEAATIRSIRAGRTVVGIQEGFKWIMQEDITKARPLCIEEVSRIHFRGGSYLKTSRANPTKNPAHLENAVRALLRLGVTGLITIGGDDTCFSALSLERVAKGLLRVVHVPKTIDNDLDLPLGVPTFGFQTARHLGTQIVENILEDAWTTSRWFFVVAMGRNAGHLALGIGKAAGATLTLIPEEFQKRPIKLRTIVDTLAGAIIKRLSADREDGVAVLAEGLAEAMDPADLSQMENVERDEHGHIALSEIDLGSTLRKSVLARLAPYKIKPLIRQRDLGFELRCADPIPFDMEYTRDLGYSAATCLLRGNTAVMVSMINGRCNPIPFDKILDPTTGRTRVRMAGVNSEAYRIAREYMIRLEPEDFVIEDRLKQYATLTGLTPQAFREQFGHVAA